MSEAEGPFSNSQQQDYYEALYGVRFRVRRAHEIAIVLILRPFAEAQPISVRWRLFRALFGGALQRGLQTIVRDRAVPGTCFIGLEKPESRISPPLLSGMTPVLLFAAAVTGIVAACGSYRSINLIIAAGWAAAAFLSYLARLAARAQLRLKNRDQLTAALAQLDARAAGPLAFFEADDSIWKEAILEFSSRAAVILADVGQEGAGLEWEIKELGRLHGNTFAAWSINALPASVAESLPEGIRPFPLVTHTGNKLARHIFPVLAPRRKPYDAAVARAVLRQKLAGTSWQGAFWEGVETRSGEAATRVTLLREAWQASHAEGGARAVYPALALLDALALDGSRGERLELQIALLEYLARRRTIPSSETPVSKWRRTVPLLSNLHCIDQALFEASCLRSLLEFAESGRDTPLAVWQYRAMLDRRGLVALLNLERFSKVAERSIPLDTNSPATLARKIVAELDRTGGDKVEDRVTLSGARELILTCQRIRDLELEVHGWLFALQTACSAGDRSTAKEICAKAFKRIPTNHRYRPVLEAFGRELDCVPAN